MGLGGINPIKPAQTVNSDNLPQQQYVTPATSSPNTTGNSDVRFATPDLLNLRGQKLEMPSKAVPPPAEGNPAEPALSREAVALLSAKQLPAVSIANPEQLAAELKTLLTRPGAQQPAAQSGTAGTAQQPPSPSSQTPQDVVQLNRPDQAPAGTQTYSRESLLARARPETLPAQTNQPAPARPQVPTPPLQQNPSATVILTTPKEAAAAVLKNLPDPLGAAQTQPRTQASAQGQAPNAPANPPPSTTTATPGAPGAPRPQTANIAAGTNNPAPGRPVQTQAGTPQGPVLVTGQQTPALPAATPRQPLDFSGTRRADSVRLQILRATPNQGDAAKLAAIPPSGAETAPARENPAANTNPPLANNINLEARADNALPLRAGQPEVSDVSANLTRPQVSAEAISGNEPARQEIQQQAQGARAPLAAGSFLINSSPLSHAYLSIHQDDERHGRAVNPGQPPPISVSLDIHTPHAGLVKIRLALSGLNLTGNMAFTSAAWADEAAQALPRLEAALAANVGLQNPSLTVQVEPDSRWGTYGDGV